MNGHSVRMKISMGLTSHRAVTSARSSAIHFGASSPSTICTAVMTVNATATLMLCAVVTATCAGRKSNEGCRNEASAGSPIHPSPRLAMVMPSCVAAMYLSGDVIARRTARAPEWPSAIS